MSIEKNYSAAHFDGNQDEETLLTKDDGSIEKTKELNESDFFEDKTDPYFDEHKMKSKIGIERKKSDPLYDKKRGKVKKKDFRLN